MKQGDCITAKEGVKHQISNNGEKPLVIIECAIGEFSGDDMSSTSSIKIDESQLGYKNDPIIKMTPALKDYYGEEIHLKVNILLKQI